MQCVPNAWKLRVTGTIAQFAGQNACTLSANYRNISAQSFDSITHASSKSWGTYLLSLCFCAHSFNGIELRYSFSDSFNRRTISSNEVGVWGMSMQDLPQF